MGEGARMRPAIVVLYTAALSGVSMEASAAIPTASPLEYTRGDNGTSCDSLSRSKDEVYSVISSPDGCGKAANALGLSYLGEVVSDTFLPHCSRIYTPEINGVVYTHHNPAINPSKVPSEPICLNPGAAAISHDDAPHKPFDMSNAYVEIRALFETTKVLNKLEFIPSVHKTISMVAGVPPWNVRRLGVVSDYDLTAVRFMVHFDNSKKHNDDANAFADKVIDVKNSIFTLASRFGFNTEIYGEAVSEEMINLHLGTPNTIDVYPWSISISSRRGSLSNGALAAAIILPIAVFLFVCKCMHNACCNKRKTTKQDEDSEHVVVMRVVSPGAHNL
mmetsp:Transcript_20650/g.38849  ORF Transcript_20650/g.38849 Transcript_20650/m.38849 type:complete len:333 (-) Transcript_20650:125-1123(-)